MATKPRTPAAQTKRARTASSPKAGRVRFHPAPAAEAAPSGDELSALVLRACLIARDAVFNVRDTLADGSRLAFLAIKDCEKELDQIERKIDEQLPGAITASAKTKPASCWPA